MIENLMEKSRKTMWKLEKNIWFDRIALLFCSLLFASTVLYIVNKRTGVVSAVYWLAGGVGRVAKGKWKSDEKNDNGIFMEEVVIGSDNSGPELPMEDGGYNVNENNNNDLDEGENTMHDVNKGNLCFV